MGSSLIVSTLGKLERGEIVPHGQDDSQASLARPLKRKTAPTDRSLTAAQIYNRIRGLEPWPGVYTAFRGRGDEFWARPEKYDGAPGSPGSFALRAAEFLWLVEAGLGCGSRTCGWRGGSGWRRGILRMERDWWRTRNLGLEWVVCGYGVV